MSHTPHRSPRSFRHRPGWQLATVLAVAILSAATFAQPGDRAGGLVFGIPENAYPNFDIRLQKELGSASDAALTGAYLEAHAPDSDFRLSLAAARITGVARLEAQYRGLHVADNHELGITEIVSAMPGTSMLSGPGADRPSTLLNFLGSHSAAYGITPDQVGELHLVADYMNPAGNMGWAEFEQRFHGIPVFQGLIRGGFTAKGELAATTGLLASGVDPSALATMPVLPAAQAVSRSAALVGWQVPEATLVETASAIEGHVQFEQTALAGAPSAWLTYFVLAPGTARLAWATQMMGNPDSYLTVLDAEDGTLLFRKNLTNYQTQSAAYTVYASDSPAPSSPTPALPGANYQAPAVSRTTFTLIGNEGANSFNSLGWMTDGTNETAGNNVIAGMDLVAPNGVDATVAGSPNRVFNFTYNPATDAPTTAGYRNGEAVNMFYWTNRFHDATYLLGFTEQARNFQVNNFGRGGLGNDRVLAEGQDYSGTNNANFATPVDGGSGRMQMYVFNGPTPNRSSGLDQDVLIHELTHGLSNRLHSNAAGLAQTQSRGMGEGWSDFYARALLSTAAENVNGVYAIGGWVTNLIPLSPPAAYTDNYYYGIRRFPYAVRSTVGGPMNRPHNPLTFADIDPTQFDVTDGAYARGPVGSATAFQFHNIGEVWASALFEVRARFITRLGFATGNQRILQFVTDGMKLDPVDPTLVQGRDAILAAANAGGGNAADIADIWDGFAVRGLGVNASTPNAGSSSVVESFLRPGDAMPAFSINDVTQAEGNAGLTNFTFTVTRANPGGGESRVSWATADGTAIGRTHAPTNATVMTIPSSGAATPYPSTISVVGVGTVRSVGVRLNNVSHTWPDDLDIVLVGPGGQRVMLMSDAGGSTDLVNVSLEFRDGAPALPDSGAISSGIYRPTDYEAGETLPAPAPVGPYGTSLSVFNGTNANGMWNLYVADDQGGDSGSIGGWTLFLSGAAADYVPAAGELTFGAGVTTQTVTVQVVGDATVEPNETFAVNLSNPTNAVIADGQGVGTILNDDGGGGGAVPTSANDAYVTPHNTTLTVPAPGVLGNDNTNGGGAMTAQLVSAPPPGGTFALNANGGFTFTPNPGFIGTPSFTYRAVNSVGQGNVATVWITVQAPAAPPQPPTNLRVDRVAGNTVTLRWARPATGPAPTQYVIEGGTGPGTVMASMPTGHTGPIYSFNAPNGSFYVRVHSVVGAVRSSASNEVPLFVNVPVAPSAPSALLGLVQGNNVSLRWRNTFGGGAPTNVVVDVTGTLSTSVTLGASEAFDFTGVPNGSYTFRVRGVNAGGAGPFSNTVTLSFPTACSGAPQTPVNLTAFRVGGTAYVLWDPVASGPAATSYVLNVTGSFTGTFPTTARMVSSGIGPGTYNLTVRSVNACGQSSNTGVVQLVVP